MTAPRAALAGGAAGAAVGLASALIAARDRVPEWEVSVTRWFDRAPDSVAAVLWPVMQCGTLWAPFGAAAVLLATRKGARGATVTMAAGLATWALANLLKRVFTRPRPVCCIPGIDLRGAATGGYGFPSGHSAVAACLAVLVVSLVPRRWRWLPIALAVLVGVSRMVYGAHFPVDVLGGWVLGALVGGAGSLALRPAPRPAAG